MACKCNGKKHPPFSTQEAAEAVFVEFKRPNPFTGPEGMAAWKRSRGWSGLCPCERSKLIAAFDFFQSPPGEGGEE